MKEKKYRKFDSEAKGNKELAANRFAILARASLGRGLHPSQGVVFAA